jgi:acyl dehydratase
VRRRRGGAWSPSPTDLAERLAELRSLIGTRTTGAIELVERNDIRDFAEAVRWPEAPLPRYVDERQARRTAAGGIVAPPTYLSRLARVRGFSLPMPVPAWWSPLPGILASVEVEPELPIRPGDALLPEATVVDVAVHATPQGTLAGILRDFVFTNQLGERVGRTRRTVAKFLDAPLFDRTGLEDRLAGQAPPRPAEPGDVALPAFERLVTLMELNRFAAANREWGQYHMDPEFARTLGLAGALVIEHLKLAYLANMLEDWLGDAGRIQRISASFLALDVAGARLTTQGWARPAGERPGGGVTEGTFDCSIWIEDQHGRAGTIGSALIEGR